MGRRYAPNVKTAAAVEKRAVFMLATSGIVGSFKWKFRLTRENMRAEERRGEEGTHL